jgi:hypothetical protein
MSVTSPHPTRIGVRSSFIVSSAFSFINTAPPWFAVQIRNAIQPECETQLRLFAGTRRSLSRLRFEQTGIRSA